jgi:predicted DNA-binding transcriptional regulator YafY
MSAAYIDLKRKLCILRHLLRAPADKYELADFVEMEVDAQAYDGLQSKAGNSRFEGDMRGLRDWGCDIQHYEKCYHLHSYGDFSPVGLDENDLNTMAFLQEAFAAGAPQYEGVQRLLTKIADWLPAEQRDSLASRQTRFRLNLRQRDAAALDGRVENAIQKALRQGRLLRFGYRSPSRTDGEVVVQTVQPWSLLFDTMRGHHYLDAFWLTSRSAYGEIKQQKWQKFRLDSIVAEQVELLPDKRPPLPPKRPSYQLEYWLSPRIVRHGHVTRHFDSMFTHETNREGWIRVTGSTDDLFSAVRLLLTYGDNCLVTGGGEVRREIERLVKGMAELYSPGERKDERADSG